MSNWKVITGDAVRVLPTLKERFNAVVTDPPYPREYLPVLGEVWRLARSLMAEDGWLFVMSGQSWLPEVMAAIERAGWFFRWCGCFPTPHANTAIWPVGISTGWKPLLIYGTHPKQKFAPWKYDVISTTSTAAEDKANHEWGQGSSQFLTLIRRFELGPEILDPFCGSGTTGVAAVQAGCGFVGIEIDERHAKRSNDRIGAAATTLWTQNAPDPELFAGANP